MFEPQEDNQISAMLRDGLSRLPVPVVDEDFSSVILAQVRTDTKRPVGFLPGMVQFLRPTITAAACSLAVTLALLAGVSNLKSPGSFAGRSSTQKSEQAESGIPVADLAEASLGSATQLRPVVSTRKSPSSAGRVQHSPTWPIQEGRSSKTNVPIA